MTVRKSGATGGSGSMAARRRLGRLLTELREAKGITQGEAADYIERVPSTLYRMETGKPGVRIRVKQDIHGLCELYGVDTATREGLVQLAEATRVKGWYQPYQDLLVQTNFDSYVGLEQDAAELDTYEAQLVPGLLQTDAYARTLVSVPDTRDRDADEIDRRVRLRLGRQQVLTRPDPLRLDAVVSEAVLRQLVGGPDVMAEQLRYLVTAGERPNHSIRVLPLAAGLHDGLVSGSFALLRFPDGNEPPMVYSDVLLGGLWFEEPREIDRFTRAFSNIGENALSERASRELIHQTAKELAPEMYDLAGAAWRKSSRSNNSNNCVEVAIGRSDVGGVVGVRDSKDADGPVLIFQSKGWTAFVGGARSGAFAARPAG